MKFNSPALKVQTIMGRDIAAFVDPEEAFNWVEATAPAGGAVRYIRPDGEGVLHVKLFRRSREDCDAVSNARAALMAWACPDDEGRMQA